MATLFMMKREHLFGCAILALKLQQPENQITWLAKRKHKARSGLFQGFYFSFDAHQMRISVLNFGKLSA